MTFGRNFLFRDKCGCVVIHRNFPIHNNCTDIGRTGTTDKIFNNVGVFSMVNRYKVRFDIIKEQEVGFFAGFDGTILIVYTQCPGTAHCCGVECPGWPKKNLRHAALSAAEEVFSFR